MPEQINNYVFSLEKFRIGNTRARHEDTDAACFGLKVGDKEYVQIKHIGNVNNGEHPINLRFGPIPINDSTPVEINFQIVNSGNKTAHETEKQLNETARNMFSKTGTGKGDFITTVAIEAASIAIKYLKDVFNADCDGPVAVDNFVFDGARLRHMTQYRNIWRMYKYYPGIDSAIGCGSNSKYWVLWSITKQ